MTSVVEGMAEQLKEIVERGPVAEAPQPRESASNETPIENAAFPDLEASPSRPASGDG